MDQFLVPQFIDVEPKILGPLTLRQFLILVVAIVVSVISYRFADLGLFILEFIIVAALTILFGFIKINGQGFDFFLLNIINVLVGSNIRIWKKFDNKMQNIVISKDKNAGQGYTKEELKGSRLSELSLLLDTGGAYQGENIEKVEERLKKEKKI